jgi:hypothetical protein
MKMYGAMEAELQASLVSELGGAERSSSRFSQQGKINRCVSDKSVSAGQDGDGEKKCNSLARTEPRSLRPWPVKLMAELS